ncbi:MAG: 16S rRNA (cytosine(1402)-N(4))-methyltransferase, partial [Fulvivirga sp.]|nr:16S rRNA (cytosine(1402)-N(4))-methyltransferase [Fulvivirga sp.]
RTLAEVIASERVNQEIKTTEQLIEILRKMAKKGKENRYFAQVFQALRIEVNDELKALEDMLEQSADLLKPRGRLVVMSYHSLEDRLVKNFMLRGHVSGKVEKDFYGNVIKPLEAKTRKPVTASEKEIIENNRARSAKLRIAEKL